MFILNVVVNSYIIYNYLNLKKMFFQQNYKYYLKVWKIIWKLFFIFLACYKKAGIIFFFFYKVFLCRRNRRWEGENTRMSPLTPRKSKGNAWMDMGLLLSVSRLYFYLIPKLFGIKNFGLEGTRTVNKIHYSTLIIC